MEYCISIQYLPCIDARKHQISRICLLKPKFDNSRSAHWLIGNSSKYVKIRFPNPLSVSHSFHCKGYNQSNSLGNPIQKEIGEKEVFPEIYT